MGQFQEFFVVGLKALARKNNRTGKPSELRRFGGIVLRVLKKAKGFFPITWSGIVFICLAYVVWFGEVTKHYNQILFASVSWLVAAFSLVFVVTMIGVFLVALVTYRYNKFLPELSVLDTGQKLRSGYRIYRPAYLPFIQIDISPEAEAPFIARYDRKGNWIDETVTLTTRGRYESIVRTITVRDIFGLSSVTFDHNAAFCAEIRPSKTAFESIQFAARASGEGYSFPTGESKGELVEMRRYQAGDPLRYILWRVFARSRKLLVRAPEPAVVEEQEMFLYFIAGQEDNESASLTRSFLSTFSESDTELHFCADGSHRIVHNAVDGIDDVVESVKHRSKGGENILEMIKRIPKQASQHCFMMVPRSKGIWIDHVREFCTSTGLRPNFVMAVKAAAAHKKASLARRLLCNEEALRREILEQNEICEALAELGDVQLVDIDTGAFQPFVAQAVSNKHGNKKVKALPRGEVA